jgi:hypothetical protein
MKICIDVPDEWLPTIKKFEADFKDREEFVRYCFLQTFHGMLDSPEFWPEADKLTDREASTLLAVIRNEIRAIENETVAQ